MGQTEALRVLVDLGGIATSMDLKRMGIDDPGKAMGLLHKWGVVDSIKSIISNGKGPWPLIYYIRDTEYKKIRKLLNAEKLKMRWKINHQKHRLYRNEYCLGYYYLNKERILANMREAYQKKKLLK